MHMPTYLTRSRHSIFYFSYPPCLTERALQAAWRKISRARPATATLGSMGAAQPKAWPCGGTCGPCSNKCGRWRSWQGRQSL